MPNLYVFDILFLVITSISSNNKLSPVEFPIPGRILLVYNLIEWLQHDVVGGEEEEWNRKPLLLSVDHHSVLWTLIFIIAPNLKKHTK